MDGYLRLEFGGLTAQVDAFFGDTYPRKQIGQSSSDRNILGGLTEYGPIIEAPYQWEIEAFLNRQNALALEAIYFQAEAAKRSRLESKIKLIDTMRAIVEAAPATREILPAPWNGITTPAAGLISYCTSFWVRFAQPPEFSESVSLGKYGAGFKVKIVLQEYPKKTG